MNKLVFVLILVWLQSGWTQTPDSLVGQWTFDDPDNLAKATVGNDLVLIGSHTAVDGPDVSNGAVNIGIGSYYINSHDISPNGGGNRVNDFTIVIDIKIPYGRWYVLYQTDESNLNDGDWAINPEGAMGIAATGYTAPIIEPGEWYRLAISVENGERYDYYMDGQLLIKGSPQSIDGRFSLGDAVLFFADDNAEDGAIDVAEVMMFSRSLSDNEINNLGGYGHTFEVPVDTVFSTYLQTPSPTSIYVCWYANESTESIVEYGTTESLGNSTTGGSHVFNEQLIWHWVHLTDLTPKTVYYYRVITDTVESKNIKFKTPPPDGNRDGHVRFAVIGDTRTDINTFSWLIDNMKAKMIELYGDDIESNINCVLNLGDIVTDGYLLSEYKNEYFNPIAPISGNMPFMVSIGNHENEAPYYYHHMKYEDIGGPQGEKYYSFRVGRVLFIALNSNWQLRNDTQIDWLDGLLQDAEEDTTIDWIFTFCHHPGHSEMWVDGNTPYVQDRIIPILTKYRKVDMLMYGHSHNYERGAFQEGNLRLMLDGGGGSNLDRWGEYYQINYPEIQKSFDHYSYTIIDIDVSNKIYYATTFSLGHPDKYLNNVIIDQFYRDKADTSAPDMPAIVSPEPGTQLNTIIPLVASPFSGNGEIMSSHFQISGIEGDYSSPFFDVIRNYTDIYGDTGPPNWEPIDLNSGINLSEYPIPAILLWTQNTFWWRVRYRNRNLQWSDWSEQGNFITVPPTTVERITEVVPKENKLYDNYPNPFNSMTHINFQLMNSEVVTINIYDITGLLVKRLLKESRIAGNHSIIWNGTDENNSPVSSGVYFIKINTRSYQSVQKASLIK